MAEGWEVRNVSEGSGVIDCDCGEDRVSVLGCAERRDWSCAIIVALLLCVRRMVRFNFRVSWTLRRRERMESGVGVKDGTGRSRPCDVRITWLLFLVLDGAFEQGNRCWIVAYLVMS